MKKYFTNFTKKNMLMILGNALAYIILGFLLLMVLVMLGAIEGDAIKGIINIFVTVIVGLMLLGVIAWCVNAFLISRFVKRDK
ncbi:hypothetical protein [Paenibacillus sp. OV219]|uniref:hypothetical protein n=1 Tax=Paenibacillus sp. OV219 TaxID=1884377 RepID=UPI0008CB66DE|nr:hypothetical protein [Paenibacillus sp. OV219]SEM50256.1 hypothetical protein SAMN05518847_1017 [Paenibacillus sp. OV219]